MRGKAGKEKNGCCICSHKELREIRIKKRKKVVENMLPWSQNVSRGVEIIYTYWEDGWQKAWKEGVWICLWGGTTGHGKGDLVLWKMCWVGCFTVSWITVPLMRKMGSFDEWMYIHTHEKIFILSHTNRVHAHIHINAHMHAQMHMHMNTKCVNTHKCIRHTSAWSTHT